MFDFATSRSRLSFRHRRSGERTRIIWRCLDSWNSFPFNGYAQLSYRPNSTRTSYEVLTDAVGDGLKETEHGNGVVAGTDGVDVPGTYGSALATCAMSLWS